MSREQSSAKNSMMASRSWALKAAAMALSVSTETDCRSAMLPSFFTRGESVVASHAPERPGRGPSGASPEPPCGKPGALGQRGKFQPDHARMNVVEPDARRGKSTVGAGDDVLAPDDPGEAGDALGD